ncbi:MAG TPA: integrase arm-type DNA-binding domain-containing protein [Oscillatoriaceae cyanobacterium]
MAIRRHSRPESPIKLSDGEGLHLLVQPNGSRLWRLAYRFGGKQKTLALGSYPDVSLAEARGGRRKAKAMLRQGDDPGEARKAEKRAAGNEASSFEALAKRWHESQKGGWVPDYAARVLKRLEQDVFPDLGARQVASINSTDVLRVLRNVERRGAVETARRLRLYIRDVFGFAQAERLVDMNPAEGLTKALKARPAKVHRRALAQRELPEFLRNLKAYDGGLIAKSAIRLTLLTAARTSEVRFSTWDEFDLANEETSMWRLSPERMKVKGRTADHLVPLSRQAREVLLELRPFTGDGKYVFASDTKTGCISENTMLYGLYRMGYHNRATIHGFRRTASTILNEHGFNRDWIERQLAHLDRDEVRAAYNAAEYLPERRRMMQWWADYVDEMSSK